MGTELDRKRVKHFQWFHLWLYRMYQKCLWVYRLTRMSWHRCSLISITAYKLFDQTSWRTVCMGMITNSPRNQGAGVIGERNQGRGHVVQRVRGGGRGKAWPATAYFSTANCASGGADWPKSSDEELSFRSRLRRWDRTQKSPSVQPSPCWPNQGRGPVLRTSV